MQYRILFLLMAKNCFYMRYPCQMWAGCRRGSRKEERETYAHAHSIWVTLRLPPYGTCLSTCLHVSLSVFCYRYSSFSPLPLFCVSALLLLLLLLLFLFPLVKGKNRQDKETLVRTVLPLTTTRLSLYGGPGAQACSLSLYFSLFLSLSLSLFLLFSVFPFASCHEQAATKGRLRALPRKTRAWSVPCMARADRKTGMQTDKHTGTQAHRHKPAQSQRALRSVVYVYHNPVCHRAPVLVFLVVYLPFFSFLFCFAPQ
jgi:hypothetical protein